MYLIFRFETMSKKIRKVFKNILKLFLILKAAKYAVYTHVFILQFFITLLDCKK